MATAQERAAAAIARAQSIGDEQAVRHIQEALQTPLNAPLTHDPSAALRQAAGPPVRPSNGAASNPEFDEVLAARPRMKPLESFEDAKRLYNAIKEMDPETLGPRERAMYEQSRAALEVFMEQNPKVGNEGTVMDPRVVLTPVPTTGDPRVDQAGETVRQLGRPAPGGRAPRMTEVRYPGLDELAPDDPVRLKADMAAEGADFRRGLPFVQRFKAAFAPNIPRLKGMVLQEAVQNVPADLPAIAYDPRIQNFLVLQPITQEEVDKGFEDASSVGKFRWVAVDEAGMAFADVADLFNMGEIGSIVGSVAAAGKLPKGAIGFMRGAGQQGAGGLFGRLTGEALSVLDFYRKTGVAPTYEELKQLGFNSAAIEAIAGLVGEGLGRSLDYGNRAVQSAYATGTGRVATSESAADVAATNARIAEFQEDARRIRDVNGNNDYTPRAGEVTENLTTLERENSFLRNASTETKRTMEMLRARTDKATQDYVDNVFGGNRRFYDDRYGAIVQANNAILDSNKVVVSRTEDGTIHVANKLSPNEGMTIMDRGGEWQIHNVSLPADMRGQGFGKDLYRAAIVEGKARGKALRSDTEVSESALNVWRSLDGDEDVGKLVWNRNIERVSADEAGRPHGQAVWQSTDGRPVVQVAEPTPITPQLLEEFRTVGRDAEGKMRADKEFARFLRRPGVKELGTVVEEMKMNPYIKQEMKEAILADFDRTVNKNGRFSVKAFEEWKNETGRVLENVFDPDDMIRIRNRPGGLRAAVEEGAQRTEVLRTALSRELNVGDRSPVFTDPTGVSLWNQIKRLDESKRRNVMSILRRNDADFAVQGLFREELRDKIMRWATNKNTSVGRAEAFDVFLKENRGMIQDVLGPRYNADLQVINRMLKRRGQRGVVTGVRAEANPNLLAMFRVVFGPLSRKQRGLTAARRWQVRSQGERAVEIITDPDKLRTLVQFKDVPIQTRQGAAIAARLGLADWYEQAHGMEILKQEEDRQRMARMVSDELAAEEQ